VILISLWLAVRKKPKKLNRRKTVPAFWTGKGEINNLVICLLHLNLFMIKNYYYVKFCVQFNQNNRKLLEIFACLLNIIIIYLKQIISLLHFCLDAVFFFAFYLHNRCQF